MMKSLASYSYRGLGSTRRCGHRASVLAIVIVLCAAPASLFAASAASCNSARCCMREQDQVWLVSHRSAGCDTQSGTGRLQYWRYDCERSWVKSSLEELLASDSEAAVTSIFVHGNRISGSDAFTVGWSAYRAMVRSCDERPVRFIIWSWPAEITRGLVADAREKAWRTNPAAYYLGWFVDQLHPQAPISLWGHSYGARVITGSLHLLGGGSIAGYQLSQRQHDSRDPVQVVLLAAALDDDWLLPGHCHGEALSQVSGMLLVNNGCDAVLRRYRLIYGRRANQQALGQTGLNEAWLAPGDDSKVDQLDACCLVGKRHALDSYLCAGGLLAQMRPYLFFAPSAPAEVLSEEVATVEDRSTALEAVTAMDAATTDGSTTDDVTNDAAANATAEVAAAGDDATTTDISQTVQ